MTEPQNPQILSAKAVGTNGAMAVSQKPRRGWNPADRDELGEMRPEFTPGILCSQDFITVDRHLWAAFQQMDKHMEPPTEYCKNVMRRARKTQVRLPTSKTC